MQRFTSSLTDAGAAEDVRRVANVIASHQDEIAVTVAEGGQRGSLIARILDSEFDSASANVQETAARGRQTDVAWTKLHEISVGPFRGFRWQVTVPLASRFLLFYGPNGSGKSSLCEALEYALLGECLEAEARRLDNAYFENIHAGAFVEPEARHLHQGRAVPISPDRERYYFCFIEKNRIEGFARMAARPRGGAAGAIAALFGIDPLNRYVRAFSDELVRLPLSDAETTILAARKESVAGATQILETHEADYRQLAEDELALIPPGVKIVGVVELAERVESRLAEIGDEISTPIAPKMGAVVGSLRRQRKRWVDQARLRDELDNRIAMDASQVAFSDLYDAVLKLQEVDASHCPACKTPIGQVAHNPFVHAHEQLQRLGAVSELQRQRATAEALEQVERIAFAQRASQYVREVYGEEEAGQVSDFVLSLTPDATREPGSFNLLVGYTAWWRKLLRAERICVERDESARLAEQARADLLAEQASLIQMAKNIAALRGRRATLDAATAAARAQVAAFDAENSELLSRVEAEQGANARVRRIRAAYADYVARLKTYLAGLPGQLVANLNAVAMELYNAFNEGGRPEDDLVELRLPTSPEDRVLIKTAGSPASTRDALLVLSEGHLRCLGLAILLAKNLQLELPLIVFDDVVNAIDHDHRGAIRAALFDARFARKQFIITSHSNEFIKDLQNQATSDKSKLTVIKPHSGDFQPRLVDANVSRHYVERAQAYLEHLDHRSALAHARQALECQLSQLWREMTRARIGQITLDVPGLSVEPELQHFAGKLNARWKELVAAGGELHRHGATLQPFTDAFASVVGIQHGRLWFYLNKGAHDAAELDDFEAPLVRRIVDGLAAMEVALSSMNLKKLVAS
ncbi:AAA family ATPase [Pseudoxanthomonas sp. F37]|uniref:AAA family ATPase n=1 Tax=Pseudoxanthomonas sp. F37 TaxID=2932492 RepID=UPI001FD1175F|nr:AAA family ATPase [Pseudoxanthomonas sp. F37]UOV07422.1 AAA family ATPase [Pseudoxanthomonas sp. F37]